MGIELFNEEFIKLTNIQSNVDRNVVTNPMCSLLMWG